MANLNNERLQDAAITPEMIDAAMEAYGFNKKEAKAFLMGASEERRQALVENFKAQAKKSFGQDAKPINWFQYDGSTKFEEMLKFNIAASVESFVNSIYDLGEESGWVTASDEEWAEAVYKDVTTWFNANGRVYKSNVLRFGGRAAIMSLIYDYLEHYEDRKEAIAEIKDANPSVAQTAAKVEDEEMDVDTYRGIELKAGKSNRGGVIFKIGNTAYWASDDFDAMAMIDEVLGEHEADDAELEGLVKKSQDNTENKVSEVKKPNIDVLNTSLNKAYSLIKKKLDKGLLPKFDKNTIAKVVFGYDSYDDVETDEIAMAIDFFLKDYSTGSLEEKEEAPSVYILRRKGNKFIFAVVEGMWENNIATFSFKKNESMKTFVEIIKKFVPFDKDADWLIGRGPGFVQRWGEEKKADDTALENLNGTFKAEGDILMAEGRTAEELLANINKEAEPDPRDYASYKVSPKAFLQEVKGKQFAEFLAKPYEKDEDDYAFTETIKVRWIGHPGDGSDDDVLYVYFTRDAKAEDAMTETYRDIDIYDGGAEREGEDSGLPYGFYPRPELVDYKDNNRYDKDYNRWISEIAEPAAEIWIDQITEKFPELVNVLGNDWYAEKDTLRFNEYKGAFDLRTRKEIEPFGFIEKDESPLPRGVLLKKMKKLRERYDNGKISSEQFYYDLDRYEEQLRDLDRGLPVK